MGKWRCESKLQNHVSSRGNCTSNGREPPPDYVTATGGMNTVIDNNYYKLMINYYFVIQIALWTCSRTLCMLVSDSGCMKFGSLINSLLIFCLPYECIRLLVISLIDMGSFIYVSLLSSRAIVMLFRNSLYNCSNFVLCYSTFNYARGDTLVYSTQSYLCPQSMAFDSWLPRKMVFDSCRLHFCTIL